MINALKLEKGYTRWIGYIVITLSLILRLFLSINGFKWKLRLEETSRLINTSLVLIAFGLYLIAFSTHKLQSPHIEKVRTKADRIAFLISICIMIGLALVSAVYPQRVILTSETLSLMAISVLLIYNVYLHFQLYLISKS